MRNLAKFSVEKAITVFMAVILIGVFGVVSYTRLTTDLFPSMNIPYAVVVTTYVGASPDEIEETISRPLESVFSTTTNIKEVISISQENVSIITLEFQSDTNMDSAMIEMRESLDMATSNFPDEAGNPMIIKINLDMMPVMAVSIAKEGYSQLALTEYIEDDVLPLVERIGGVASVSMTGAYQSEIRVTLDEAKIADTNADISDALAFMDPDELDKILLDKEMISMILQAQNFSFPTGYVNVGGVNYLVRVGDEFEDEEEMKELVLFDMSSIGLDIVKLKDVSTVEFVNANEFEYSKVNGDNAITLTFQKSSNYATTDVTEEILSTLALIEAEDWIDVTILLDQGEYINQSTGSVSNNLLYGSLLALAVLFLFLRSFRATFIVGVAIPISLLFAVILIYLSGITLNIVSLGGLALGIGMLVDNSIVVMENIFRMKKLGYSNKDAAIEGTTQVAGAITASTLTTISVFLPIMFIEGFIKEIFIQMALTIAFSLSASLIIALTLVPSIASKILVENDKEKNDKLSFLDKMHNWYQVVFNFSFKFKYIVLGLVVVLFGGSIFLAQSNGFEYFPASDEGSLNLIINNPTDESLSFEDFTGVLDNLNDDITDMDDVETVGITLGGGEMMFLGISDKTTASVNIILEGNRSSSTMDFEKELSDFLLENYSNIEYEIQGTQMMTSALTGSGIQIQLSGYSLLTLKSEAEDLAAQLEAINGVKSVDPGIGKETEEIKITVIKETAIQYGITVAQVLGAVADEISLEKSVSSIVISGTVYEIYVYDSESNYSETEYTIADIENIVVGVNFMTDELITVADVADVEWDFGFSTITRVDNSRVVTIDIEIEEGFNTSLVAQDVDALLDDYTAPIGYEVTVLGENEEIMEAVNVLAMAVGLAVVLIYMIMASQFQSLSYPFIIMFTIPLAFTGGFAILYIFGMPISIVALIGLIILTGVVVNNGIVLVDYTNQLRAKGLDIVDALLESGKTRMRPILMTAITTILALSTMAIGVGEGAEMMQPMALTTIGGLLYATVLTLIVVPIMYYLVSYHVKGLLGTMSSFAVLVVTGYLYASNASVLVLVFGGLALVIVIVLIIVLPKPEVKSLSDNENKIDVNSLPKRG